MENRAIDVEQSFQLLCGGEHFTYEEFRCKCPECFKKIITPGQGNMDDGDWFHTPEFRSFTQRLGDMRETLGFPFTVNSGYRCPECNDQIYVDLGQPPGGHLDGPHTIGAADIKVSFERAYLIVGLATDLGMGVGISQKGPVADRFIHLDNLGPRIWTY